MKKVMAALILASGLCLPVFVYAEPQTVTGSAQGMGLVKVEISLR